MENLLICEVDNSEALLLEFPAFPSVFLNLCLVLMMRSFNCNREVSEACEILLHLRMERKLDHGLESL